MPDQVERGCIPVFCDVEHLLFHLVAEIFCMGAVYGIIRRQTGDLDDLFRAQPVKLQPYVLPRQLLVCDISTDLAGEDHESLPALYLILPCDAF